MSVHKSLLFLEDLRSSLIESKEKIINKLPKDIKLFHHNSLSNWDGKLAVVYSPEYAHTDFDPKDMTRTYDVFFVDGGKGRPLNVKDWKEMIGKPVSNYPDNRFSVSGISGRQFTEALLKRNRFLVKTGIKELNKEETRIFIRYLEDKDFLDVSWEKKFNKKFWETIFKLKPKVWDVLYSKFGTDLTNNFYNLVTVKYRDGEDKDLVKFLNDINGVFSTDKKVEKIKWIVSK